MSDWRPFFPFPEVRPPQVKALDFLVQGFAEADDFFIESPTGTGKSPIAITLARWLAAEDQQTYLSTINIPLEEQYVKDFKVLGLQQLHAKIRSRRSRAVCSCSSFATKILAQS